MKVAIAGAGIIGLSTAWRLARAGANVHLFDPRPPGHGATLAALAALWPASPLKTDPLSQLDRDSLALFESFTQELASDAALPVTYRRCGRIEILNSAKAVTRAHQEVAAAPQGTMSVIDFPTAQSLDSGLAPFPHAALRCNITAQVRIQELVAALIKACQRATVTFHAHTLVTGLHHAADRIIALQTPAEKIAADAFLITAGAWTPQLSPLLAAIPIRPAKGQGIALRMPSSRPLTSLIKSGPIYLIPWDDEILVGSTTEPAAGFDETPTPEAKELLRAGAAAIIPELAEAPILRHWSGLRPQNFHKPHYPLMGPHPNFKNLFLSAGHYKTGIALAPLASQLVAQSILNNQLPDPLALFLPKIPP